MINSKEVKEIMFSLGADLCGIAGLDRFEDAPKGYHPRDVLPQCRSVISFGCRFPTGTLQCTSHVPYTRVRNSITSKMDAIALDFCIEMEKRGAVCVPIPTNESQWDENTGRWRSVVSLKHAAQAAGLSVCSGGIMGLGRLQQMLGNLSGACPGRSAAGPAEMLGLCIRG